MTNQQSNSNQVVKVKNRKEVILWGDKLWMKRLMRGIESCWIELKECWIPRLIILRVNEKSKKSMVAM